MFRRGIYLPKPMSKSPYHYHCVHKKEPKSKIYLKNINIEFKVFDSGAIRREKISDAKQLIKQFAKNKRMEDKLLQELTEQFNQEGNIYKNNSF